LALLPMCAQPLPAGVADAAEGLRSQYSVVDAGRVRERRAPPARSSKGPVQSTGSSDSRTAHDSRGELAGVTTIPRARDARNGTALAAPPNIGPRMSPRPV